MTSWAALRRDRPNWPAMARWDSGAPLATNATYAARAACSTSAGGSGDVTLGLASHALTPGPGRVRADLPVGLPEPRDQITTKELPGFVRLRTEVSRLVRGRDTRAVT